MARKADPEFVVDFPTLWIAADWIEAHCIVPDGFGFLRKDPFVMYEWQLWCTLNHYRVKPTAKLGQLGPAFYYRRSQIIAPQKIGKGPWSATIVALEAAGPALFNGWAAGGEYYDCRDYHCGCGWVYEYEPGEAMGIPWPTPLIQITATSEDQTDNVYRPLQAMVNGGPLSDLMKVREGFIRLPNNGRIDVVTSSAQSRLGNPITFPLQDETGIWTEANRMQKVAETQRRGVAGMAGRSMETTNMPDPSENSVGQRTMESRAKDVFRFHRLPPAHLRYTVKADRRKIHAYVYRGSTHVDLDSIEGEAAELLETDPGQAERFFGNRSVAGLGAWLVGDLWERTEKPTPTIPKGDPVAAGFDGSDSNDWTAIRLITIDGHRFTPTYGPDKRPTIWDPNEWGGTIPRGEVHAAWDEICRRYRVVRAYCDPRDWQSEIGDWALKYGDQVFVEWATYRVAQMYDALERAVTDLKSGRSTHDACPITKTHVANARKVAKPGDRYILAKASEHQKIDAAMADVMANEASADAHAAGVFKRKKSGRMTVMR